MKKSKDVKINTLCKKCERSCKQSKDVTLVDCPNFIRKAEQLVIKFDIPKKRKKKAQR